jgi:hypothetical protein
MMLVVILRFIKALQRTPTIFLQATLMQICTAAAVVETKVSIPLEIQFGVAVVVALQP